VPLPWAGSHAPFGFGPGGTPWLPQPSFWARLTVAAQEGDPESTLTFYRAALRSRRSNPALGDGTMTWLDAPDGALAFRRGFDFACVVNYNDQPVTLPTGLEDAETILQSTPAPPGTLPGGTAIWLRTAPPTTPGG
jgi:alpha-glucosidase